MENEPELADEDASEINGNIISERRNLFESDSEKSEDDEIKMQKLKTFSDDNKNWLKLSGKQKKEFQ